MAGKGNAQAVLGILDNLLVENSWKKFFEGFAFPYGFFSTEEYIAFLAKAGLTPLRVELFSRDMKHAGEEGWHHNHRSTDGSPRRSHKKMAGHKP